MCSRGEQVHGENKYVIFFYCMHMWQFQHDHFYSSKFLLTEEATVDHVKLAHRAASCCSWVTVEAEHNLFITHWNMRKLWRRNGYPCRVVLNMRIFLGLLQYEILVCLSVASNSASWPSVRATLEWKHFRTTGSGSTWYSSTMLKTRKTLRIFEEKHDYITGTCSVLLIKYRCGWSSCDSKQKNALKAKLYLQNTKRACAQALGLWSSLRLVAEQMSAWKLNWLEQTSPTFVVVGVRQEGKSGTGGRVPGEQLQWNEQLIFLQPIIFTKSLF